jgi:hypothetical protein
VLKLKAVRISAVGEPDVTKNGGWLGREVALSAAANNV